MIGRSFAAIAVCCSAVACSDSASPAGDAGKGANSSAAANPASAPKAGEVVVTVGYAGKKVGPSLSVALFTDFPPKGPPAGVGQVANPSSYPQTIRVANVAAGKYIAVVRLTAQGNDPQAQTAQPGDLQAASKLFEITAKEGVGTSVELVDP